MFGLGVGEIVVILVVALIFIGPKKLPGLAKGLGKGVREFQNALGGITDQIKNPSSNSDQSDRLVEDPNSQLPEGHEHNEDLIEDPRINDKKADS